jgi:hypothetical protein
MTPQDSENSEYYIYIYIQFIAESTTPKAMTLQQIREAQKEPNDPTLQHAAHIIHRHHKFFHRH